MQIENLKINLITMAVYRCGGGCDNFEYDFW